MTIAAADFRSLVIEPALAALAPAGIRVTNTAADLLMATAAMETDLGTWLSQVGGPALGVFQIEPATLTGLLARLRPAEAKALATVATPQLPLAQVESNLVYAAAICRLYYWHDPMLLPPDTVSGLWNIYKAVWNTPAGAATMNDFTTALKLTDLGNLPQS
jgi:hypothetical protein